MVKKAMGRIFRQPISFLAVVLLAAVFSVVLCYLHRAQQEEQRCFEETYRSVPVSLRVTDLDGSDINKTNPVEGWIADLFFPDNKLLPGFSGLVKDLQLRMSHPAAQGEQTDEQTIPTEELTGITSLQAAQELTVEYGGDIRWHSDFDESVFASGALVCIVPDTFPSDGELRLTFTYKNIEKQINRSYTCVLQIVGCYTDGGNRSIYCPYAVVEQIYARLGEPKKLEHISATLRDNSDLSLLRETADHWFARPNSLGEPTVWGKYGFEYYFYAMDINDTLLKNLETNMRNSLRLNQLAFAVVFALSAGAGFLTGFLVIRARKREIALMRTMGASPISIFGELAVEQLICILVGILLGGSYTLWQPIGNLGLFGGIYLIGLSTALVIFLRKNLLTTIKEDE